MRLKRLILCICVLAAAGLCGPSFFARADTPPCGAVTLSGVDIYHGDSENGQIDWRTLARTQNFVYVKADEGEHTADPMFRANYLSAEAWNIPWGPYHFLRLYSEESARQQADTYWERIRGTGWTLRPAVDAESCDRQRTAAGMRACVRAFVAEFTRVSGWTPLLYTCTDYANEILRGAFADCPLWLADYRGGAGHVAGWNAWTAWQYSERGGIQAVSNDEVDLDRATDGILLRNAGSTVPRGAYPYIVPVRRGTPDRRTVRTAASWSGRPVGNIRVGDRYEIMSPVDKNGWVQIGLGGRIIGTVSAYCF